MRDTGSTDDGRPDGGDPGISITGRAVAAKLLVRFGLIMGIPLFVVCMAVALAPGTPMEYRVYLLILAALTGGLVRLGLKLRRGISGERLAMHVYRDEILILRDDHVTVIPRDEIGCLVRWGTKLFQYDTEGALVGEWDLGWKDGIRAEQKFERAMRRYDYPCRIFFDRVWPIHDPNPPVPRQYIEVARTGAMERDPQLGPVDPKARWGRADDMSIKPGPGLTDGPMAEYLAALERASQGERP